VTYQEDALLPELVGNGEDVRDKSERAYEAYAGGLAAQLYPR